MTIETTRRGFLLLVGTLLAAGAVNAAPHGVQTKLQSAPSRFGYLIYKDGQEFARFVEGGIPDDFEFEIQHDAEVFAIDIPRGPSTGMFHRTARYLHFGGKTYIPRGLTYRYDEDDNIDWLEVANVDPFNPDTDRLEWVMGRNEPLVIRNVYSPSKHDDQDYF